jgi:peptide deformylase
MLRIRIIGDDVLREKATKITEFDDDLKNLADEMIETMHDNDGIGLAAPQVGISKRLLVTDISEIDPEYGPMAFVNPEIIDSQDDVTMEEGCLSIPDIRESVTRPREITLRYQTVEGEEKTEKFDDWMARVIQHEIDHLEGVLFTDYLSPVKQKLLFSDYQV